jgi:hypothetical protein
MFLATPPKDTFAHLKNSLQILNNILKIGTKGYLQELKTLKSQLIAMDAD